MSAVKRGLKDLQVHWDALLAPSVGKPCCQQIVKTQKQAKCFVNNSLFENQESGCLCVASLAAALFGGQPLVSLLGDGQTDSLSSGQGHPRLVALETEDGGNRNLLMLIKGNRSCRWNLGHGVLFCGLLLDILKNLSLHVSERRLNQ